MSKYSIFGEYLAKRSEKEIGLSFERIEEILGFRLPPTAYKQRAWWSNNASNSVMTKVWRKAGFRTKDVDMTGHHVTFVLQGPFSSEERARQEATRKAIRAANRQMLLDKRPRKAVASSPNPATAGMADGARPYSGPEKIAPGTPPRCRHPLYGALKGYIRLVAGTDLTEPADPEWGERVWGDDAK